MTMGTSQEWKGCHRACDSKSARHDSKQAKELVASEKLMRGDSDMMNRCARKEIAGNTRHTREGLTTACRPWAA